MGATLSEESRQPSRIVRVTCGPRARSHANATQGSPRWYAVAQVVQNLRGETTLILVTKTQCTSISTKVEMTLVGGKVVYDRSQSESRRQIDAAELTTFDVEASGQSVRINVRDHAGWPAALSLPADCLPQLLMALPKMTQRALHSTLPHDASQIPDRRLS
jgi:hypothetical protein